ncbi:MAG: SGNH/GDSL hydrolase family protein [candidate division Zixibacteria bacterium]|nr:SGNH/GDSL hydrolase family protein [Candidatus Tariuqbacter arcticus]
MAGRKISGWAAATVSTLLFVAVLEVGLRVIELKFGFLPAEPPQWIKFSPTLHFEIQPNIKCSIFYTLAETNSYGLRNPEFSLEKRDTFRIVCLGNSCTFGNLLHTEETYCRKLESLFRQRFGGKIQVINAGIPGYTSYQGSVFLNERALSYKPDLLIVSYGFNDRRAAPDSSRSDSPGYFRHYHSTQKMLSILRRSYTYRLIELAVLGKERTPIIKGYNVRVDSVKYGENLRDIARTAGENSIPVVYMGIPDNPRLLRRYKASQRLLNEGKPEAARQVLSGADRFFSRMERRRFNQRVLTEKLPVEPLPEIDDVMTFLGGLPIYTGDEYNDIMAKAAEEFNSHYVDLGTVLTEEHYADFIHFNPKGAEITAVELFKVIVEKGYAERLK